MAIDADSDPRFQHAMVCRLLILFNCFSFRTQFRTACFEGFYPRIQAPNAILQWLVILTLPIDPSSKWSTNAQIIQLYPVMLDTIANWSTSFIVLMQSRPMVIIGDLRLHSRCLYMSNVIPHRSVVEVRMRWSQCMVAPDSQDSRLRLLHILKCLRKRLGRVVAKRLWQCAHVVQQAQALRQGLRCFLLRDDTGVEFDVDGIACETATLSLQLLLFCTVVDVAVIAARATVCANVWAVPVGDETISSSAVVLAVDAFVDVRSMTYPAGLRPTSLVGIFLHVLKCLLKAEAEVVANRRPQ
jgi:hypothetical protein